MHAKPSDRDLLLVVDVQNDFLPGGALAVPDGDAVVPLANTLAQRFAHVALTQDWHVPGHLSFASSHAGRAPFETITLSYGPQILWPDHCVQGSFGAEFSPALSIPGAELIVRKGYRREIDSYSAFCEADGVTLTGLAGYLRERGFNRVFSRVLPPTSALHTPRSMHGKPASRWSSSKTRAARSILVDRSRPR